MEKVNGINLIATLECKKTIIKKPMVVKHFILKIKKQKKGYNTFN